MTERMLPLQQKKVFYFSFDFFFCFSFVFFIFF